MAIRLTEAKLRKIIREEVLKHEINESNSLTSVHFENLIKSLEWVADSNEKKYAGPMTGLWAMQAFKKVHDGAVVKGWPGADGPVRLDVKGEGYDTSTGEPYVRIEGDKERWTAKKLRSIQ